MKARQFLAQFDQDHRNDQPTEQKLRWLQRIELTVMSDVMHQYDERNKKGIENEVILHPDNISPYIDEGNSVLDISELPHMYIEGGTLVLTDYDPEKGESEAQSFNLDTFLQIPAPYDTVYEYYLCQKIAEVTGNIKDYNNYSQMYNTAYLQFMKYYNRTHRKNHVAKRVLRHEVL